MKTISSFLFAAALCSLAWLAQSGPADAYLDPGTGSIILQMVLGGVAGGLVVMRLYWARIKDWFALHRPGSTENTTARNQKDENGSGEA